MSPPAGRRPRSLQNRLALLSAVVTTLAALALGAAFLVLLDRSLATSADDLLRTRIDAAASLVAVDADGHLRQASAGDDPSLDNATWVFQGARALERAPGTPAVQAEVDRLVGRGSQRRSLDREQLLLRAQPLSTGGRQVGTVVGALSLAPLDRTEDLVQSALIGLGLLVVAGSSLATRSVVGRALRPVSGMTEQAEKWSATDVDRRFGTAARPTELNALARTLDGLLDRLAAVLRHEQHLTAELSHELRTPLARIVAEVELLQARDRDRSELAAGHQAISAGAERLSRILETLLSTARTDGQPTGSCDPAAVLSLLAADYRDPRLSVQAAPGRGADAGPSTVGVDADVLERILAPLVDNALRYARTRVSLRAVAGPAVEVVDDGPGLADELLQEVFAPGRRGAPDDRHAGAGLGLTLSRRLARAAGGEVTLSRTPDGLLARVTLPAG